MATQLTCLTRRARTNPKERFTSLMGLLSRTEGLRDSFERQPGRKASGVDGIRKADYEENLEENLSGLSEQLRRLGYRPKPSRRVWIPKAGGGRRPLGIPSFEDRIVQDRLSGILQSIWEPEFRNCSYGFRPRRNAHAALRRLAEVITNEQTQWVVEADIRSFFDRLDHRHLMRFLEHRIGDRRFLRIVQRFLKAGIMEDGAFHPQSAGSPQGGLVSPVLANIYLHYVLDEWFEGKYAKSCRGRAFLVRYADDFVACFTREEDARRFLSALAERLAAFELEVEPEKTALLQFGSRALRTTHSTDGKHPSTFNFLGFTHYVGRSRRGRFLVGRKTEGKRQRKGLQGIKRTLRALRITGGSTMIEWLRQHLRGHIQYYGVSGNSRSVGTYVYRAAWILFRWLNRRSQKRSITWGKFTALLKRGLLPRARIVHNLYPKPTWMT